MQRRWMSAVAATAVVPFCAMATNGLNLIGFGTESVAMAGADTAVARDTSALNTNPAGLAQLARPAFDGYLAAAFSLDVGHSDSLGNNRQVDNHVIPLGGFGISSPWAGGQGVVGLGFFAQGGAGAVYKSLRTPFGTDDELSGLIGIVRVTPGLAWRLSDELTLGAAAPLNVIVVKQRVFPGTSALNTNNPAQSFFGLKLDGVQGAHLGLRLGAMWKPDAAWTFGASYSPKTKLDAKRGDAEVNFSAIGLGVVPYGNARIEGFALAREIALGAAWQASARTLVSLKLAHLDWSNAIRNVTVTLSEPGNAAAPAQISQTARVDWRDQTVTAIGVAQALSDKLTAYAGFNHARNPAPSETLTPLLAAIRTRHATSGFTYRVDDGWLASGAIEYQFRNRVVYNNPNIPLGAPAEERSRYVALNCMLSRRW